MEVDKCGKELAEDPEKSFSSLMHTLNGLFSKLDASIGHLHALRQVYISLVAFILQCFQSFAEHFRLATIIII